MSLKFYSKEGIKPHKHGKEKLHTCSNLHLAADNGREAFSVNLVDNEMKCTNITRQIAQVLTDAL